MGAAKRRRLDGQLLLVAALTRRFQLSARSSSVQLAHIAGFFEGKPLQLEGANLVLIPPRTTASRELIAGPRAGREPQAWLSDGSAWDATPEHQYSNLLRLKLQKALRTLRLRSMPFPAEMHVYESARRHFRMRSYFEVDRSDGGFEYEQSGKRLREYSAGSVRLNEALTIIRSHAQDNRALRKNLHSVLVHTVSNGDAVVMLNYLHAIPSGWRASASKVHKEEGIAVVGLSFPAKDLKYAWWAERQGRILCDRDSVVEQFTVGDRVLEYEQAIGVFSQPNFGVCQQMLQWAEHHTRGLGGDLLELYCGNGCFTLALAHNFRQCLATEKSMSAVRLARDNAARNNINNVRVFQVTSDELSQALRNGTVVFRDGDLEVSSDEFDFRAVLVDPPREGLDRDTADLVASFDLVVYISCNPKTLQRDLKQLSCTHSLKAFAFFDQFPYTRHIECGSILVRKC